MSTRWDHFKGIDDAAVAWQCEVDNKTRDAPDFDIYPKFKGVYNASLPRPLEKRDSHLERRYENIYEAIRPDKQQWLFMRADPSKEYEWKNVHFDPSKGDNVYTGDVAEPNRKKHINAGTHQFYIVSAAHLWNMIPRCLYAQASYEFAFTANNTGVTVLDHCGWANYSQLWNVTLWKPASFVLGEEANPSFAVDPTDFWLWDARTAPIWWASFAFFTLVLWMCH
ncbi:hypothetical protein BCR43DRAFT_494343 [Syncephalastrum racemosum]|uniref:Uncharacterized protein n=1 Tax=Syncephalastrum racemosum TaxID=13706 RepID=A0A1X2H7X0_SYNRA|nr:hypothetical protein BCR43DRAFT_494343 [Syncephalastrum racemosum]